MERIDVRGIHIAADIARASGELIVFIHGVGADRTSWKYQLPYFHQLGYSVAAIDLRGSGDSDARDAYGTLLKIDRTEYALDVDAFIHTLGYERAHWVGNSLGGVVIQEAERLGLTSLDRIVLCDTFAYYPDHATTLPRAAAALAIKPMQQFATERIPLVLRSDIDRETLDEAIYAMARKDPEAYLASWQTTWSPDFRSIISGIRHRTLVVCGTDDAITPMALSEELAGVIIGARLEKIAGAGHISNLDRPNEFNAILEKFLKEK
ncbi:MAG: alpha/beta fold hydrolase [Bacteroidetes bacterium]|nr:alpha/beta fold hydrolase [Bacteroidota bacterium]